MTLTAWALPAGREVRSQLAKCMTVCGDRASLRAAVWAAAQCPRAQSWKPEGQVIDLWRALYLARQPGVPSSDTPLPELRAGWSRKLLGTSRGQHTLVPRPSSPSSLLEGRMGSGWMGSGLRLYLRLSRDSGRKTVPGVAFWGSRRLARTLRGKRQMGERIIVPIP